jgi:phage N-6-adenine-methyltransferase
MVMQKGSSLGYIGSRSLGGESDCWSTPKWVTEWVLQLTGWPRWDLDPCCSEETAKAPRFITEVSGDGLSDPWIGTHVWVNPPYSSQKYWLKRCAYEADRNQKRIGALVLPSFDAEYWRPYVWEAAKEIWMIEKRIAFERDGFAKPGGSVRTCIVIYGGKNFGSPVVRYIRPPYPSEPR